jgi:2-pyrone-4,6-dicarboxylate lactonase
VWVKLSCPERLSVGGPPALDGERDAYADVVPFARRVVEEFPDPTPELQRKLLVDNPMRLYWPADAS